MGAEPRDLPSLARAALLEVAQRHGVSVEDMQGGDRMAKVSHARQEAMHLLAERCRYTPAQVGQHVGNRDHTTVVLGIKAHRRRVGLPDA